MRAIGRAAGEPPATAKHVTALLATANYSINPPPSPISPHQEPPRHDNYDHHNANAITDHACLTYCLLFLHGSFSYATQFYAQVQFAVLAPHHHYNVSMPNQIPPAIQGQKYIRLTTFRKNGEGVATPVWFGEDDSNLYVMTRSDSGKHKRIRNNPQVQVAPCTIRGVVAGAEFEAKARILPPEEHQRARKAINRKYWLARIPFLWRADAYLEVTFP